MTIAQIETVLTPALRSSPGTFAAAMEAWMVAHPTWTAELNAIVADINATTTMANTATAAKWVSGTTYDDGVLVWSPTTRLTYRRKGAGGGTTDPVSDSTNWAYYPVATQAEAEAGTSDVVMMSPLRAQQHLAYQFPKLPNVYSARTGNTILAAADNRTFIDITSGTFSQTITAAATLGAGWGCYYTNSGTGVVTLDADGAELINGSSTLALYQYDTIILYCTGTAFVAIYINRVGKTGAGALALYTAAGSSVTVPASGTLATTSQLPAVASQGQMETGTDNAAYVTALATKWHPGVAKAWIKCGVAGGTPDAQHNITSITDDGTGQITVTLATDFSSANYVISGAILFGSATSILGFDVSTQLAGSFSVNGKLISNGSSVISAADPTNWFFACYGDQ